LTSSEIELPSIEQIERIESIQKRNLESLEISDNTVRCQKCGNAVPMTPNNTPKFERKGRRICSLRHRIMWVEKHNFGNKTENLKQLKQEYAELLQEDEKADRVRNLNLFSCKITKFLFVCSSCFDKLSKRQKNL
jgi:hypothetical protein